MYTHTHTLTLTHIHMQLHNGRHVYAWSFVASFYQLLLPLSFSPFVCPCLTHSHRTQSSTVMNASGMHWKLDSYFITKIKNNNKRKNNNNKHNNCGYIDHLVAVAIICCCCCCCHNKKLRIPTHKESEQERQRERERQKSMALIYEILSQFFSCCVLLFYYISSTSTFQGFRSNNKCNLNKNKIIGKKFHILMQLKFFILLFFELCKLNANFPTFFSTFIFFVFWHH